PGEIDGLVEIILLDIRQQQGLGRPARIDRSSRPADAVIGTLAKREPAEGAVIVVQRQADLMEIVLAFHAIGRLADLLNCWKQKTHKNSNDGDDYQQFDERETGSSTDHEKPSRLEKITKR